MKILPKTMIQYLLLVVVTLLVVGLLATSTMKSGLRQQTISTLTAVRNSRVDALNAWGNQQKQQIGLIAQQAVLIANLKAFLQTGLEVRQRYLNQLLRENVAEISEYESFSILSGQGRVVASTEKQILGADYSQQSFVGDQASWAIEPFMDKGQLKIYLVKDITWNGKKLATMLVVGKGQVVQRIINDNSGLGQTGEVLLVQSDQHDGVIFISTGRDRQAEPLRQLVEPEQISPAIQAALSGKDVVFGATSDYLGQDVIAVAGGVPGPSGWGMVVKISTGEAFGPLQKLWWFILGAAVLMALGAVALAYANTVRMTRAFRDLLNLLNALGQGELDQHLQVQGQDELAEVAKAFNSMINCLRRSDWQQSMQMGELDSEVQQRRVQEAKLHDHHKLTDFAMKIAHLGIWQVDIGEERVYLSAVLQHIYGVAARDISLEENFALVAEDERGQARAFYESALKGENTTFTYRVMRADGTTRQLSALGVVVLKDKNGKAVRLVGVSQEIVSPC